MPGDTLTAAASRGLLLLLFSFSFCSLARIPEHSSRKAFTSPTFLARGRRAHVRLTDSSSTMGSIFLHGVFGLIESFYLSRWGNMFKKLGLYTNFEIIKSFFQEILNKIIKLCTHVDGLVGVPSPKFFTCFQLYNDDSNYINKRQCLQSITDSLVSKLPCR